MSVELRDYETLSILDPDLGEEALKASVEKSRSVIEGDGGTTDFIFRLGK